MSKFEISFEDFNTLCWMVNNPEKDKFAVKYKLSFLLNDSKISLQCPEAVKLYEALNAIL